jgi:hypothetical protein
MCQAYDILQFQHLWHFETLKRQGYRILICAMNDGGYGSEFHKLRADGVDDSLAIFGRPPLENIARGFGLRGHEIRDVAVIPKLFADFTAQGESEVLDHPDLRPGHGADHARARNDCCGGSGDERDQYLATTGPPKR